MEYVSTRGEAKGYKFEDVLFKSYASDGGMFMPTVTPKVSIKDLQKWKNFSYPEIVQEICKLVVSDEEVPFKAQKEIIKDAFKTFDTCEVVHLARLKNDLNVLELWHGATLAFKDLAMTCTTRFLNYFLKKRGGRFTALVVTSGDTGSSAIEGARGMKNIDVVVGFPYGRIDRLQELMMTTVQEDNVHVFGFDGSSDDIDIHANKIFDDKEFSKRHHIGSFNSLNWCRIMVQVAHHVYAYLQVSNNIGDPVDIVIPSGGCGNLAACVLAIKMGVPLRPTCAVNNNITLHRILRYNDFRQTDAVVTVAPSMDIAFPYNIERVFWLLSNKNGAMVKQIMEELKYKGSTKLPDDLYKELSSTCGSYVADNDLIIKTMQRCWKENEYHICPHTATAVAYAYQNRNKVDKDTVPMVCVATAALAKFANAGKTADLPTMKSKRIDAMTGLNSSYLKVEKDEDLTQVFRERILDITKRQEEKL